MVVVVSLYRIIILVERGVYFQCGIRVTESVIIEYVVFVIYGGKQFIFFIIIVAGVAVSQYNIFPVDDFVLPGSKDGSVSRYGGPMPRAVLVFHFDEAAVFIFQVFFPFAIVTTVIPNVQPVVVLLVGAVLQCNFVLAVKGLSAVLAQVGQASVHVQALYRLWHGDLGTGMVFPVFGSGFQTYVVAGMQCAGQTIFLETYTFQ